MIDTTKLKEALTAYKNDFAPLTWNEERYKWETVKHFQDNWDVNATDFAVMLENSLAKTDNLLMSQYNYPKNMIVEFAQKEPEQVRSMFINLFDEGQDYYERVKIFKQASVALLSKYGKAEDNHYHSENVITIYLWLRYPDKYYIFKLGIVRNVAKYLHANYHFKKGAYAENLRNHLALYDELCAELQKDAELVQLLHSQLTPDCYPDSALHTLTIDVGYYISQSLSKQKDANESNMTATVAPAVKDDTADSYTKADFLTEVYMTEERYDHLTSLLKNKKNVILQGAPGVGKTFCAKRLAWSMIGKKDESRIEFIQFHQNYSYEDFMMGYKPEKQGFELKYGVFYRFCQQTANHPDKEFFFLIDEINRGNMSKIFGELLMLIERDYREHRATLAYNGLPFSVPKNLYLIGMMNTADRSLAIIDYALRRRFSFFEMEPGFDSPGFASYQRTLNNETLDELVNNIKSLNSVIAQDKSLGSGFCIGHSYLCGREVCDDEWLQQVVDYDILPMLSEYWFDDESKVEHWSNVLHGVFQ